MRTVEPPIKVVHVMMKGECKKVRVEIKEERARQYEVEKKQPLNEYRKSSSPDAPGTRTMTRLG